MSAKLLEQGITLIYVVVWGLIVSGVGRFCLTSLTIRLASRAEGFYLSAGIGLTVSGYVVFLLGVTGSLHPSSIWLLLISLVLLSVAGWTRPIEISPAPPFRRSRWDRSAAFVLCVLLAACLLMTLTPETQKDALIYHLAVPKLYLHHHGFYFIPGNIFAGYPLLGEMQYVLGLFLAGDILAKMMHFSVLCATLCGIGLFCRFVLRAHAFPALSMLIFLSIPSVFAVSHAAYNDLFVAFFTLAALYSFFRWSELRLLSWLILCGIFSGSAAACKYTALLVTPLGILGILWYARRWKIKDPEALRLLILYTAAAFAAGAPFYLKNWIVLGNPLYPFFYGIFGGRGWDSEQAHLYEIFLQNLGMGRNFLDYLILPFNLSLRAKMDGIEFDGVLGPIFLLTLPFLAGLHRWETPIRLLMAYALLTFLFWAFSAQQIRYLIPLLATLAIVTGALLTRYKERKPIFVLLLCLIAGSFIYNGYHIINDFMSIRPLRVAVGIECRDDFLTRTVPTYPMYRFVNRNLPLDSKVFLVYMKNYTFLCDRECYSDAMFEEHTLLQILRKESSTEGIRNRFKELGFSHILYNNFFLLGQPSALSDDKKKLFLEFQARHLSAVHQDGAYRLFRLM